MARPSTLTLLTIGLLILLPALALLQYRWVGQVSEAERDRMERNLRVAAFQFRAAFDGEMVRAVNGLRVDVTTAREDAWYRYADRHASWLDTAEHPGIVESIFLVDVAGAALRLRRWNPATHAFEPVDWPTQLVSWKRRAEQRLAELGTPRAFGMRFPVPDDDSIVVTPLGRQRVDETSQRGQGTFGFTILRWNMDAIRTSFLPALTDRHFRNSDGDRYRVAIVDADDPARVIYESDPSAPVDQARADASEPLFVAFRDPLNGRAVGRGDGRRFFAQLERGRAGGGGGPGRDFARWTLLVQHESGSLEAAVGRVRRRNLAVSFGVLMLLTVSTGLLMVSSRRAQRLARQQMEFVAGVSHELRTPVAVIRSAAENLSHGVVGSADRVRQYGQAIETEARRLGDMVERVLQYAGIASGIGLASRVPVAPADIIESAVATAIQAMGAATIDRRVADDLPPVVGDPTALRSAVENLIANAVKYGGADRWVGIRAARASAGRDEVAITVEDHGPGIPGEDLPHIFNAFYRGKSALSQQIHGNGLGLALVRQIVSAHGGRVTVASRPGAGSAFTIHLPVHS